MTSPKSSARAAATAGVAETTQTHLSYGGAKSGKSSKRRRATEGTAGTAVALRTADQLAALAQVTHALRTRIDEDAVKLAGAETTAAAKQMLLVRSARLLNQIVTGDALTSPSRSRSRSRSRSTSASAAVGTESIERSERRALGDVGDELMKDDLNLFRWAREASEALNEPLMPLFGQDVAGCDGCDAHKTVRVRGPMETTETMETMETTAIGKATAGSSNGPAPTSSGAIVAATSIERSAFCPASRELCVVVGIVNRSRTDYASHSHSASRVRLMLSHRAASNGSSFAATTMEMSMPTTAEPISAASHHARALASRGGLCAWLAPDATTRLAVNVTLPWSVLTPDSAWVEIEVNLVYEVWEQHININSNSRFGGGRHPPGPLGGNETDEAASRVESPNRYLISQPVGLVRVAAEEMAGFGIAGGSAGGVANAASFGGARALSSVSGLSREHDPRMVSSSVSPGMMPFSELASHTAERSSHAAAVDAMTEVAKVATEVRRGWHSLEVIVALAPCDRDLPRVPARTSVASFSDVSDVSDVAGSVHDTSDAHDRCSAAMEAVPSAPPERNSDGLDGLGGLGHALSCVRRAAASSGASDARVVADGRGGSVALLEICARERERLVALLHLLCVSLPDGASAEHRNAEHHNIVMRVRAIVV